MDTESILNLKERSEEVVRKREYDYVVDLSHVMYIGSTGLGYLAFLAKYRKNFLFLSVPPEEIRKPFKLLEMEDIFKFYKKPGDLLNEELVPESVVPLLVEEIAQIRDIQYHKRWVKILRDYLSHDEVIKEIKRLTPYIKEANESQKIFLPSEVKYTCILYKFLDRAFNDIAKIDRNKIDYATLELIAKELMTNAVRHGYEYRKDGVVQVKYETGKDRIEIKFIDYGKGFIERKKVQELPRTGLELLKKLFDEVTVSEAPRERVKGKVLGKGTMVKMVKKLKAS
jgi:anti-sigma regulatory factor (Ser/Thr protein kinase)/anti-anti-sigma regulatory factor